MNFTHLFTTARVIRATYQIISTTILLYYIASRAREKKRLVREDRRLERYRNN